MTPPDKTAGRREPVVLASYLSARSHYRPVMFSQKEIFCGPDAAEERDAWGYRSVRTPVGAWDMGVLAEKLPAAQKPDVVVVKTDATNRSYPRNLHVFDCPKVLVLGDTQHLKEPLRRMMEYAQSERFDFILSDHNRHHLHFFRDAGFANVHWLPCLTWRPYFRDVPAVSDSERMVFVGQVGRFHPYRSWLMKELTKRGLPLDIQQRPQDQSADAYAAAAIALNCSLNGDVNLRTFEILAAGGLLFTDRLSPESGLERILRDGEHCVLYDTPDDLADKARYYLDHPDEALAIRRRGRAHVEAAFSPDAQSEAFLDLVFEGRERPEFTLDDGRKTGSVPVPHAALWPRLSAYETVQDVHRSSAGIRVFAPDDAVGRTAAADLADLRRLSVHRHADLDAFPEERPAFSRMAGATDGHVLPLHHLLLISPEQAPTELETLLRCFRGHLILAIGEGWTVPALAELSGRLGRWGWTAARLADRVFSCTTPERAVRASAAIGDTVGARAKLRVLAGEADEGALLKLAALANELGDQERCLELLRSAIRADRDNADALSALARFASKRGQLPVDEAREALLALDHLGSLRPHSEPDRIWYGRLMQVLSDDPQVRRHMARVHPMVEPTDKPRRILVINNLFPPQEMGGYGRKFWEFASVLRARGHEIVVVTGDAPYLSRPDESDGTLEDVVHRDLTLYGSYGDGGAKLNPDTAFVHRAFASNVQCVRDWVGRFRPNACLLGNIDFIGFGVINALLNAGIPTIHSLGNSTPGYQPAQTPQTPLYRAAPASTWLGENLKAEGHAFLGCTTLYPGARISFFYRDPLPRQDKLRIIFAGIVMPYKGAHVLMQALALLQRDGIDFTCTFAGDTLSKGFVDSIRQYSVRTGVADKVKFTGFLDRRGLAREFARHNVLVFPSQVDETFGIAPVEAMAAGLPVVTSATGGQPEVVHHGINGLHFSKHSAEELAAALTKLSQTPELWRRMAEEARERSISLSINASVDVIEALMSEMIAEIHQSELLS
ncbi:glycosyltransferase [Azospirillum picis]|uniref:Glycosyltransferase involved in cell wall biosynthesis n=1 Tax=Azospirillum picis TaxID=488438 RepID=A0ABU0MTI1_9PROT|nr:glycosyltransferase [Azospirillum picis]MBP2303087.1 glycosyltransferase involved in cell wall biosynthesis [Azospirillum picis]MDQ0536799.1 glycosyltransferase involved in cell wall biosynthesis [Azospirillum picis]